MPGTVVAHGYLDVLALLHGAYLYFASAPAVFRRVVEYVQHHLLETARVAGDEGQAALRRGVLELYAVVAQQLAVCKGTPLRAGEATSTCSRFSVKRPSRIARERSARPAASSTMPVEPARLRGRLSRCRGGSRPGSASSVEQGLAPAGDGRERGAQLVRDRGYELVLYAVCLANLHAHVVYCVGERAYLVVAQTLGKRTVAAVGDVPRGVAKAQYGGSSRARGTRGCSSSSISIAAAVRTQAHITLQKRAQSSAKRDAKGRR